MDDAIPVAADGRRIDLRPATDADLPWLMALRRETMDEHLRRAGVAVDEEAHRARVLHRFDCARIVVLDGRDAGLLKVDRAARPWELIQVQLGPATRGQGLGERLVRHVVGAAHAAGTGVVLHVLVGNPARRLYERCGFRVTGMDGPEYRMEA